jgi:propionyl-CoA carboxylase alpha chain
MIRKVLIAGRGVSAARIVRACRHLGIRSVAVFSEADKQSPHVHLADEAVALAASDVAPVDGLLDVARRTAADALHPGCGPAAADADLAVACESAGVTFVGPPADLLRAGFKDASPATPLAAELWDPDARLIEVQLFADRHGNVIRLADRDGSIRKNGRGLVCESPALALDEDLRRRMAGAAVTVARQTGCRNAATIRFLLTPGGDFRFIGAEPFLSVEHLVTEAATGLDLVQLQIEIAEGLRLPAEMPRQRDHAVGAALYAGDAPGTVHVWDPPAGAGDLRIEAGVAEGMRVPPSDPLLAQMVAVDGVREGAVRKLSLALEDLWVGGVPTNQELLFGLLRSQEYQDGKVRIGFPIPYSPDARAEDASDTLFAAAGALYLETSRHAQRDFLPGVPPNYRNNPYRDPSVGLRVGKREVAVSWRRLGRDRFAVRSGGTELAAEVLAFRPGSIAVALDGVFRRFRFREVAEEIFVHSPLGSRVIRRLPRDPRVLVGEDKWRLQV